MLPIWLMGFCNLPIGFSGALSLVTVPQIMAAQGMPESQIALVTTISLIPGFMNFLLGPLLDWRLSRPAYAIIMAALAGGLSTVTLILTGDVALLSVLVVLQALVSYLNQAVVGGWLSSLTKPEDKNALGTWMQAANVSGFGFGAALSILLIRNLPSGVGAALIGLISMAPIILYLWLPAPPADERLGHEGFAAFVRDVLTVPRQPVVRWFLLFLAMPAASFALSNTLSGLGMDFGASEALVGGVAGVGSAIAGVIGALVVPPLIRNITPERAFLTIGACGAVFTLALITLPLTPLIFAISMIGQNGVQAAAFATVNAIILRSINSGNPLAATQFALLAAANGLPLAYMQAIDGNAYGYGGVTSSYLTDAVISLASCAILVLLLRRRRNRAARHSARVTQRNQIRPDTKG